MRKLLRSVKNHKAEIATSLASMGTVVATTPAFADEQLSQQLGTALSTGLNQAVTDFVGYVVLVLPIGLTVFAATFGVKKAMAFFRTMSSKG